MRRRGSKSRGQLVAFNLVMYVAVCVVMVSLSPRHAHACCNDPPCGAGCYPTGDDYCFCLNQAAFLEEPQLAAATFSPEGWGEGTFRTRGVDMEFSLGSTFDGRPPVPCGSGRCQPAPR